jgi:hypothetical protein
MAYNISKNLNGTTKKYKCQEFLYNECFDNNNIKYNFGGFGVDNNTRMTSGGAVISNINIRFQPFIIYSQTKIKNFCFEISGSTPTNLNNLIVFGLYDIGANKKPNNKIWNSQEYNETTLFNTYGSATRIKESPTNEIVLNAGIYFFGGQSSIGSVNTIRRTTDNLASAILALGGTTASYTTTNTYNATLPANVNANTFANSTSAELFMYIEEY